MARKNVILSKKKDTIYYVEQEEKGIEMVLSILKKSGYQLKKISDLHSLLELTENENEHSSIISTASKTIHLLHNNVPAPLEEYFRDLSIVLKTYGTILNQLNIGFAMFNTTHYMLYNQVFLDILEYEHHELSDLVVGGTVLERERKDFQNKVRELLRNKTLYTHTRGHLANRNKRVKDIQWFGYQTMIEGHVFGAGYFLDLADRPLEDASGFAANELMVRELHGMLQNFININNLGNLPSKLSTGLVYQPAEREMIKKDITERELEILQLIYQGLSNQEIAEKLYISRRTVEFHRSNLLAKTHSGNTADLIRHGIRNGLIMV
jgi:DNA-binding CsgD family transcriptional regulator